MKFKKKQTGHYICEIGVFEDLYGETSAEFEIHVCKYFPGEMTWTGQNYYWSWEIFQFGKSVLTPDGFYHPTFADCKRYALEAFANLKEKQSKAFERMSKIHTERIMRGIRKHNVR